MKTHLWGLAVVAFALVAGQGCKVVSEKEKSEETGGTAGSGPTAPSSGLFKPATGGSGGSGFASPEFTDGPELDQSKAALRALQEADVVQIAGNRLYTVSQAAGLSVVDLSNPAKLSLLGQYKMTSKPFELFVRGDTVIALLQEVPVSGASGSGRVSRILALDATTPNAIHELSSIDVPGTIQEGRILDNVLYAASYESSSCYDCNTDPTTTVVSVDVSTPGSLRQVDREQFTEVELADGWSKRSVEISDNRLYISGATDSTHSAIQVIDISDTTGSMRLGAKVPVSGAIYSRWQMDEYLGVLRVISQPFDFRTQQPSIQTFTITDSSTITPLGTGPMTIPANEKLRSVRFDGTRAFAITYEKTDPLFTIDLSDPANPRQVGELQIPGFVYHMEIRGDRIYAMGFVVDEPTGGLHVSLFDVADLAHPTMLKRVNFGPTWPTNWELTLENYLPENENRMHQVFKVLDDQGLILVPFHGWTTQTAGCGEFRSAVQLVDFTRDDLVLRGAAPTNGAIRRALVHGERLIGVSEQFIDSFNLTDRSAPTQVSTLPLTMRAHRTIPVGNRVMRLRADWYTHVSGADIVDLADVENPASAGIANLAAAIQRDETSCNYHDDTPFKNAPAFAFGDNYVAMVVVRPDASDDSINVTDILVLDVSGSVPAVAGQLTLDFEPVNTVIGSPIAKVGQSLVIKRPGDNISGDKQDLVVEVIDLTDPTHPRQRTGLVRPLAQETTGLFALGSEVATGYDTTNPDGLATYFVDKISVADPASPTASDAVELPGLLLGRLGEQFLTVKLAWREDPSKNRSECTTAGGQFEDSTCWLPARPLQLVSVSGRDATIVGTGDLDTGLALEGAFHSENRLFLTALRDNHSEVFVAGGSDNALQTASVVSAAEVRLPVVRDTDLFYLGADALRRVQASNVSTATDVQVGALTATQPNHLSISGNTAIVSYPEAGIQAIAIP